MDGDGDDVDGDDVDHKHHLRRKDLERTVIVMLLKMMVGTVWMVLVISEDVDDDDDVDYKQHLRWPFLREDLERTVYSDDVDDGEGEEVNDGLEGLPQLVRVSRREQLVWNVHVRLQQLDQQLE